MSVQDTSGVKALARILTEISQDEVSGVAALAARTGVPRTTTFEIARRLAAAGMLRRDIDGAAAGPSAIALGFAAFRIAPLAGPAETLLSWLHERGDAFVELVVDQVTLVAFGKRQPDIAMDVPVRDGKGTERARLRMAWRPHINQAERQRISADFERVRLSLEQYLEKDPHVE